MDLVCLDTSILIWGVKGYATPGQEEMISRAKYLLHVISEAGTKAIVPSIVIGEFLLGIPASFHAQVLNQMGDAFLIAPYDLITAARFASLWQDRVERRIVEELKNTQQATRVQLRADCMIIATALVQNASCIYSHDNRLRSFAGSAISVIELPREQTQFNLFSNNPEPC